MTDTAPLPTAKTVRFPVGQNVASRRRLANGYRCAWRDVPDGRTFEISRDDAALLEGRVGADGIATYAIVDADGELGICWWHWVAVARSLAASLGLTDIDVTIGPDVPELLAVAALHFDAVVVAAPRGDERHA